MSISSSVDLSEPIELVRWSFILGRDEIIPAHFIAYDKGVPFIRVGADLNACPVVDDHHVHGWSAWTLRNTPVNRRVPYTPETLPWPKRNMLLKIKNPTVLGNKGAYAVTWKDSSFVGFGTDGKEYIEVAKNYLASYDDGDTWEPASHEVTE